VNVSRETVSHWVHHNVHFQAALNERRRELWADLVDSLRALAPKAVRVLADALEGEGSVQAAIHVLKILGFPGTSVTPLGSSDVRMITAQMQETENAAASAEEEVAVALKKKTYFRTMDNLQYGLS
jgi:hypothetical protein